MSVLKKKPEIDAIIERLNSTQLSTLKTALNSSSFETFKSFVDNIHVFSVLTNDAPSDIGAYKIQLDERIYRNGFAIRTRVSNVNYEHFLVYGESQKITIYEIDTVNRTYKLIDEYCDINELRRVVEETSEAAPGGKDAWVEEMKEKVNQNSTTNTTEIGNNAEVDGKLNVNDSIEIGVNTTVAQQTLLDVHGDAQVHGELVLDSLQKIEDTNGYPFIPDPSGHLNEALVHISTGYTWKKGFELAGFQVVAKSVFEADGFVPQTYKVYFVWNDTQGDHYGEVYVRYYEQ